jgi:hypothetical protein
MQRIALRAWPDSWSPCTLQGALSSSNATPGLKSFDEIVDALMHRPPLALSGCSNTDERELVHEAKLALIIRATCMRNVVRVLYPFLICQSSWNATYRRLQLHCNLVDTLKAVGVHFIIEVADLILKVDTHQRRRADPASSPVNCAW